MSSINSTTYKSFLHLYNASDDLNKDMLDADPFEEELRQIADNIERNARIKILGIQDKESLSKNNNTKENQLTSKVENSSPKEKTLLDRQSQESYETAKKAEMPVISTTKNFLIRPDLVMPFFEKEKDSLKNKRKHTKHTSDQGFAKQDHHKEKNQKEAEK